MKKNIPIICILLIALCGINRMAVAFCGFSYNPGTTTTTPPPAPCYCPQGKVMMKQLANSSCIEERCVSPGAATHYLGKGWTYGCCTSSARLAATEKPVEPMLSIYPNPVSGEAVISFTLSRSQHVSLRLFDVQGKLVYTLTDKVLEAGSNEARLSTGGIGKGIYFVKVETEENVLSKRIIVE